MDEVNAEASTEHQVSTLFDSLRLLGSTAKNEISSASVEGKMVIAGLIGMTAYEWGPGNETVTPILAGQMVDASDGLKGVLLSSGVTAGFTLGQQLSSSWLSRKSAREFPDTAKDAYQIMNSGVEDEDSEKRFKPFKELSLARQATYAITIGSSFNVLRESVVVDGCPEEQLRTVGRRSAVITSVAVGSIVAIADIVDQATPDGSIAQTTINVLKEPYLWVGVAGVMLSKDYLKSKFRRNKSQTAS